MIVKKTRGSIPIFWTQLPNIKYKPKPEASGTANHLEGLSRHFDTQVLNYGKQVIINLVCSIYQLFSLIRLTANKIYYWFTVF